MRFQIYKILLTSLCLGLIFTNLSKAEVNIDSVIIVSRDFNALLESDFIDEMMESDYHYYPKVIITNPCYLVNLKMSLDSAKSNLKNGNELPGSEKRIGIYIYYADGKIDKIYFGDLYYESFVLNSKFYKIDFYVQKFIDSILRKTPFYINNNYLHKKIYDENCLYSK